MMSSISKFVINRNDMEYLYTEKERFFDGIHFFVYDDINPTEYLPDSFYETFGIDSKISVLKALSKIENDIITHNVETSNIDSMISDIDILKRKVALKDYSNPLLGQDKFNVINTILLYNKLLGNKVIDDDYDYESDLVLLNKRFGFNEKEEVLSDSISASRKAYPNSISYVDIKDARVRAMDSKQEVA